MQVIKNVSRNQMLSTMWQPLQAAAFIGTHSVMCNCAL